MSREIATAVGVLAGLFAAAPACAEQCADFSLANVSSATARYNPFDPIDAASDVLILVRRTNPSVSYVRFLLLDSTASAGGPGLGADGPARYELAWLEDPSRRVLGRPGEEPSALNAIIAAFDGAGDIATEQLRLVIPRGQPMAPGRSAEELDVVFECVGGDGAVVDRGMQPSRIRIAARHVPNFSIYMGGVGSRQGVLDLGVLDVDAGATLGQLGVSVLSSVPYEMRVRSENDFHLRAEAGAAADVIGYNVTVGGIAIDGRRALSCAATPPPIGDTLEVGVAVPGPLRAHRAGFYRDVITLTFSARDVSGVTSACALS